MVEKKPKKLDIDKRDFVSFEVKTNILHYYYLYDSIMVR